MRRCINYSCICVWHIEYIIFHQAWQLCQIKTVKCIHGQNRRQCRSNNNNHKQSNFKRDLPVLLARSLKINWNLKRKAFIRGEYVFALLLPIGFGKSKESHTPANSDLSFLSFLNSTAKLCPHVKINWCPAKARLRFIWKRKLEYLEGLMRLGSH